MSVIIFNAVLKIDDIKLDGLWRVVAISPDIKDVFLAFLPPDLKTYKCRQAGEDKRKLLTPVAKVVLAKLESEGHLHLVDLEPESRLCLKEQELTEHERAIFSRRLKIMRRFFDYRELCSALSSPRGLGGLVAEARIAHGCSRSAVYRQFELLCLNGFEAGSLNPRFDRSGAPGIRRPCDDKRRKAGRKTNKERLGIPDEHPQQGMTETMGARVIAAYHRIGNPKPSFPQLYDRIILDQFVSAYRQTATGREPIMPLKGTFPSRRQVRHLIDSVVRKIDQVLDGTTTGHFNRNKRGLVGHAWEGVAGPGHCYAIDSTIGDVFLRSSINRAWIVGRPVVYIVVDVWSTAVVGFYVCLTGPSWATAKVALFSTFADPALIGSLWGYQPVMALAPSPTAPFEFLCDRGEYLSLGAMDTGWELGINFSYNPSYRPDLKGLVEVLNRITKDQQFFFVPGAIDARRKELELRTDAKESAYTLREYVQYLYWIFTQYNLQADRRHRLNAPMIAANVYPSPAGLWRFGHEVGIGYRKSLTTSRLISTLLPEQEVVVNRKGIYLGQLEYEFPRAHEEQWTAIARNFGAEYLKAHLFPGSTSKIWWPDPKAGCHEFTLSPYARVPSDICFDEWLDAYAYDHLAKTDREYQRLCGSLGNLVRIKELNQRAVQATKTAEADYNGPVPTMSDARSMEHFVGVTPVETAPVSGPKASVDAASDVYAEVMKKVFESATRQQNGGAP